MSTYAWEKNVRKVTPYTPGEQPKLLSMIKLNTNENPYPPSPKVAKVLREFSADTLRLYPDPSVSDLTQALAGYYGVDSNEVFVGVGSDDVLAMAFLTFFNGKDPILFPDITYSFYDVWADLYGIPYETQALREDFSIRREDYFKKNGGIIFPNPNAPTGVAEDLSLIEEILKKNPESVVIIDEAYVDFGTPSAVSLIPRYDNLLVVQTMSKSRAMAGMRIGYAMGQPALIEALNNVKYAFNSYTMSRTAIAAGVAAVEDASYFEEICHKIVSTREHVKKELSALGFRFPDSRSNFLFVTHPDIAAKDLFAMLRQENIIVRYFDKPRIDDYLRITIGADEEMEALLSFLRKVCMKKEGI